LTRRRGAKKIRRRLGIEAPNPVQQCRPLWQHRRNTKPRLVMKGPDLHRGVRQAFRCLNRPSPSHSSHHPAAFPSTTSRALSAAQARPLPRIERDANPDFEAAPLPRRFRGHSEETDGKGTGSRNADRMEQEKKDRLEKAKQSLLRRVRVVPASPSYFTAKPSFTDDYLSLQALLRKYQTLPVMPPGQAPRVAWKALEQYKDMVGSEPVKAARYHRLVEVLQRLNYINTALVPQEVTDTLQRYKRDVNPHENVPNPHFVDEHGRSLGVGRRKTSTARAYLVEGEGEVLINGKSLTQFFGRVHDRESAIWALKATERIDKYNIFALVEGGGTTGQAEALTLAVAKALMVHEPLLKPALRRGQYRSLCISFYQMILGCFALSSISMIIFQAQALHHCSHANLFRSWLCNPRSKKGGEKEAWSSESAQEARLG
jgi:small subunit ribosomal protein S9